MGIGNGDGEMAGDWETTSHHAFCKAVCKKQSSAKLCVKLSPTQCSLLRMLLCYHRACVLSGIRGKYQSQDDLHPEC